VKNPSVLERVSKESERPETAGGDVTRADHLQSKRVGGGTVVGTGDQKHPGRLNPHLHTQKPLVKKKGEGGTFRGVGKKGAPLRSGSNAKDLNKRQSG